MKSSPPPLPSPSEGGGEGRVGVAYRTIIFCKVEVNILDSWADPLLCGQKKGWVLSLNEEEIFEKLNEIERRLFKCLMIRSKKRLLLMVKR